MGTTDDELDATSLMLMSEIDELKRLEGEKRAEARSTPEFHDLAREVDAKARSVFRIANVQLAEGEEDSPLPEERAEQHPGDWTERSRPESASARADGGG